LHREDKLLYIKFFILQLSEILLITGCGVQLSRMYIIHLLMLQLLHNEYLKICK